ncbi:FusB/FusC family EF-G-binding protein [Haloimpatiens lingqiaonensis]|uniref:FusB/FusC family EF-G-binding protein n=1 Tax=Haloimpatiens lingqiaonensis TaxID=1380675 RepID=UPI0010FE3C7B|nr:FusB/FusC family EF-G-binding protein [Haloimpatiens lingqiaonensis]
MEAFIKKYEYNYIKKCLWNLNSAFRNCVDTNVIEVSKAYMHDKILSIFTNLSDEEKELLDIRKINDPTQIDKYLDKLNEYVYGMPSITKPKIIKLFRKEKNLKLPAPSLQDSKNVYLGWIDETTRKLFLIYNMDGKFVGMVCKIPSYNSNNTHMCSLCNHVGSEDEVAFVAAICKTKGNYKSLGFNICLDSQKCNERIVSIEKLEKILKDVNNIK